LDFLRNIGQKYSLDLNRIIAVGHSAGGHLALWLAARSKIPESSVLFRKNPLLLSGVVSLAGVGDLALAVEKEICGDAVQKLMGGTFSEAPKRYAQGSPVQLLPFDVPQILIQGSMDTIVPPESAEAYYQSVKNRGCDVSLVKIESAGHFELVMPETSAWPELKRAILGLMK
jgi:acetyl esterase/lipase